jgi:hypothetical protein
MKSIKEERSSAILVLRAFRAIYSRRFRFYTPIVVLHWSALVGGWIFLDLDSRFLPVLDELAVSIACLLLAALLVV